MVHELNMIQHVRDPTWFHIILDLILSPYDDSILNIWVKNNLPTSDNSYITVHINLPVRVEWLKRTCRGINDVDYELLNTHLAIIDWDGRLNGY